MLLSDKHEERNFTSEKGEEFSFKKQEERESQLYLKNKNGLAIVLSQMGGTLHPYAEVLIKVTVYNERVGNFQDELICDVKGLSNETIFPINIEIRGNPIQLSPFQPGIDYLASPNIIRVGSVLINSGLIEKNFKVLNTGNNHIDIKWRIYDYDDILNPNNRDIVSLKIKEQKNSNKESNYKFDFQAISPREYENKYYKLTPLTASISPKNTCEFNIKFATDREGLKSALIIAELHFQEKYISEVKMSDLAIQIESFGIKPFITVNKPPNLQGMIVYNLVVHSSGTNYKQKRKIVLMNKEKIEFKVKFVIDGPFKLLKVIPLESVISDNIYSILPNSNLQLDVKFVTPNPSNEADWPMLLQNERFGKLTTIFENGTYQEFYLKGVLKRPRISISMSGNEAVIKDKIINFGLVNVESYSENRLFLVSETDVETDWKINYNQYSKKSIYGYGTTTIEEKEDIEMIDDPLVFTFDKVSGFISGPSNLLTGMPKGNAVSKRDDYVLQSYEPLEIKVTFKVSIFKFYYNIFSLKKKDFISLDLRLSRRQEIRRSLF